jgi:HxlR-like helix-turn-helix
VNRRPVCPLTTALEIIGGKWQLIVLYALAQQPRRFNELQRLAPGVSHKVLAQTVRHLEAEGLVDREVGAVARPGHGAVCPLLPDPTRRNRPADPHRCSAMGKRAVGNEQHR